MTNLTTRIDVATKRARFRALHTSGCFVLPNPWDIGSAFTWSPNGRAIAHVMDGSVAITDAKTGLTMRLTARADGGCLPRPEACVFSADGKKIAFVRRVGSGATEFNQVCVVGV